MAPIARISPMCQRWALDVGSKCRGIGLHLRMEAAVDKGYHPSKEYVEYANSRNPFQGRVTFDDR